MKTITVEMSELELAVIATIWGRITGKPAQNEKEQTIYDVLRRFHVLYKTRQEEIVDTYRALPFSRLKDLEGVRVERLRQLLDPPKQEAKPTTLEVELDGYGGTAFVDAENVSISTSYFEADKLDEMVQARDCLRASSENPEAIIFRKGDVVKSNLRPYWQQCPTNNTEPNEYWDLVCRKEDLPRAKEGDEVIAFSERGIEVGRGTVLATGSHTVVFRNSPETQAVIAHHGTYYVLPKE